MVASTCPSDSRGSTARRPVDVGGGPDGSADDRPLARLEIKRDTHRGEWQQQVREEDGGVDVEPFDRLQRHLRGQLRLSADFEQRVPRADVAVLGHVTAGLSHEPDRGLVDRLVAAGTEKAIVHARNRTLGASVLAFRSGAAGRAARAMPYLRFLRDDRGYEHTYVLHGLQSASRPSLLYWFRTPPNVLGRPAAARRGGDPGDRGFPSRSDVRLDQDDEGEPHPAGASGGGAGLQGARTAAGSTPGIPGGAGTIGSAGPPDAGGSAAAAA